MCRNRGAEILAISAKPSPLHLPMSRSASHTKPDNITESSGCDHGDLSPEGPQRARPVSAPVAATHGVNDHFARPRPGSHMRAAAIIQACHFGHRVVRRRGIGADTPAASPCPCRCRRGRRRTGRGLRGLQASYRAVCTFRRDERGDAPLSRRKARPVPPRRRLQHPRRTRGRGTPPPPCRFPCCDCNPDQGGSFRCFDRPCPLAVDRHQPSVASCSKAL